MGSLPPLNERQFDLLVSYSISSGEEMHEAVVNAFLAANIEVYEKPTQLVDWVAADVLEVLESNPDRPINISTRIWDHRVVLSPEEVCIYTSTEQH